MVTFWPHTKKSTKYGFLALNNLITDELKRVDIFMISVNTSAPDILKESTSALFARTFLPFSDSS